MEKKLKLVAFLGSPRIGGNTDILLDKFLEGFKGEGEKIILNKLKISPCQNCESCFKDGNCIIRDDMQEIYPKIVSADRIIIASPIFFMGLSAQTKLMIDRCQALWARKYILKNQVGKSNYQRKGIFISVGGRDKKNIFEGAIITIKAFFSVIEVEYAGELLFFGVDKKGIIKENSLALKEATILGEKFSIP
jgi:multimeric flavodoxin WrbA